MAILRKRRIRRSVAAMCVLGLLFAVYNVLKGRHIDLPEDFVAVNELVNITDRAVIKQYIENKLQEALKFDKGKGCEIPKLNPFSQEVTKFNKKLLPIQCRGQDWVRCYHSKCQVLDVIKYYAKDISCIFKDIIHHSDWNYTLGPPTQVRGDELYELKKSDHVTVKCVGIQHDGTPAAWSGNTLGFRPVQPPPPPHGREDSFNVVIFGFDSVARNLFIRRMPRSWQALKDIGATVMEGYNIVGDGTPAALFPILTGMTELELPDVRKGRSNDSLDTFPFIFYKLKQDGYCTAYFEDMPHYGTFQLRFNGFRRQPADHYLRSFSSRARRALALARPDYCVGDTPQFKLMINITEQFLELDGKRFIFTFIADITHDDFNLIENADADTAALLRGLVARAEDTLLVVMGDHGCRYEKFRNTLQGKLEERLPLLAVRLPSRLVRARPHAQRALERNARALTTPHDLHATILDVLDMRQHANPYTVRGADFTRGLTMLEPIPLNRSCSEAGIEPHWCSCLAWHKVPTDDPFYEKTAHALIVYINSLVGEVGGLCLPRTLTSTSWVLRQRPNTRLLAFKEARDWDYFVGRFDANTSITYENYQVKIEAGPGHGMYEATMTYLVKENKFRIHTTDISRINAYSHEPDCVRSTHPHLNPYCYCR